MEADTAILYRSIPPALRFSLTDKRLLKGFAGNLSQNILQKRPFTCLITTDEALRRLNSQWRGHDQPTDVLSFPSEPPAAEISLDQSAGDLAISIHRAFDQAAVFNHSVLAEVQILMLHGVLHLSGLDHERDRGQMAKAEAQWREIFNLPGALITRGRPPVNSTSRLKLVRAGV